MKLPLAAFAVLAIASTAVPTVTAFPSGAGSCAEGEDKFPPASQHADKGRGTLADGGLKVWLGNVNLDEGLVGEGQLFTPVGICTGDFNDETGYNLCELCQGDCDNDAECAPGLACFNRAEDEDVPGCYGLAVSNRDYCYLPEEPEEPDVVVPDEPVPAPTEGDAALAPTAGEVEVVEEDAEPTPAPTPEGTEETTEEGTEEETEADTGKWAGVLPRACGDQCREECEECCNESNEVRNLDNCLTNIAACAENDPCDGADADADADADAAAGTSEPTPAPTPEETEEVTEEETEEVTEEGTDEAPLEDGAPDEGNLGVVDFGDCTDNRLCPLCEGDCDADTNCQDGLFCFQRDDDEDVPGCRGRPRDGLDYCIPEFYRDSVRNLKKATTPSAGGALRNNKTKQVAKNAKKKNESRKLQGDAIEFQTTRTYTLWLEGTFKGFLFRLSGAEGQDLSDVFETTVADTQIMASTGEEVGVPNVEPGSCAVGVSGACHTNNEDKEFAQVDMTIPGSAAGELELEVTAMVDKDNWYQTTYTIIAQDVANLEIPEQPVLTAAPVAAPTQAAEPTMAASEPTVAALAPTAGADLVAPEPTAAEVLPDGAVRLPSTGVEGEKEFQPVGQCSGPTGLCMQCEGDCDNDGECGDGFVCYQRVANEPVPFCYGVAMVDRDYCSLPVGATTSPGARSVASRLAASVIVLVLGVMFA